MSDNELFQVRVRHLSMKGKMQLLTQFIVPLSIIFPEINVNKQTTITIICAPTHLSNYDLCTVRCITINLQRLTFQGDSGLSISAIVIWYF